jgi:uncharacterized membrane protein YozB (DUF420 family)
MKVNRLKRNNKAHLFFIHGTFLELIVFLSIYLIQIGAQGAVESFGMKKAKTEESGTTHRQLLLTG